MGIDDFWKLNPFLFKKYIDVYSKKREEEIKYHDELAHLLGIYVSYAFNNPKKYPRKPIYAKEDVAKEMTSDDMERIARRNTIVLGGEIKE